MGGLFRSQRDGNDSDDGQVLRIQTKHSNSARDALAPLQHLHEQH